MDAVTLTFLVIGGIGTALLLVALLVGEIGHFGGPDADGPFSLPAIAAFIGGAGFVGAIPSALVGDSISGTPKVLLCGAIGVVGALPIAWGAIRLSAGLMRMRTDATLTEGDLVGSQGVVITRIDQDRLGEVRLRVAGQDLKYYARSAAALPIGTPVYVVEALSPTTVEVVSTGPADPAAPQL